MLKQKEWIETLVEKTGCSKKEAKEFYDLFFDTLRDSVVPGEKVKVAGLGTFKLRETAAKVQVNLVTGQPEEVPAHNVVTFKPAIIIDPKPEAIVVPLEGDELEAVLAEQAAIREANAKAEEEARAVAEAQKAEEEAKKATAEAQKAEEEAKKAAAEAKEEQPQEPGEISFTYEGNKISEANVKQVLRQKTALSDEEIEASLAVVKENANKAGKNEVELAEEDKAFSFIIAK